ncbi:hypothetical protein E2C01_017386 [Portunus trituberculatus]|uniref:Uncharacterized protein n=1 Tax=Portunus trituberculatus TaxID=210409 RepID=A0A5B7DSQ6_PORTR|nr:hypothetical protein [Portunus trituberculatus]
MEYSSPNDNGLLLTAEQAGSSAMQGMGSHSEPLHPSVMCFLASYTSREEEGSTSQQAHSGLVSTQE